MRTGIGKDGGPAFPVPNDANVNGQEGMSIRDYAIVHFAAALLPGFYTRGEKWVDRTARKQADAMIEERNKEDHNDEERT